MDALAHSSVFWVALIAGHLVAGGHGPSLHAPAQATAANVPDYLLTLFAGMDSILFGVPESVTDRSALPGLRAIGSPIRSGLDRCQPCWARQRRSSGSGTPGPGRLWAEL